MIPPHATIARVEFDDVTRFEGWQEKASAVDYAPRRCIAWGQLIHEDDDRVVLAALVEPTGDLVSDAIVIPASQVRRIDLYDVDDEEGP